MARSRIFETFAFKGANFRIACDHAQVVRDEIVRRRDELDAYIACHPAFATSFVPLPLLAAAPESARRMAAAAAVVGVGPMAAVAGTMAQLAVEAALAAGSEEAIVENGGDLFAVCRAPLCMGLYAGEGRLGTRLACRIVPASTPVAICSSSGVMGHSTSLGACDLATVVGASAALADAAATRAANLVRACGDIDTALNTIVSLDGVQGVLIVKDEHVGLAGDFPELVANRDPELALKVTRDPRSQ